MFPRAINWETDSSIFALNKLEKRSSPRPYSLEFITKQRCTAYARGNEERHHTQHTHLLTNMYGGPRLPA